MSKETDREKSMSMSPGERAVSSPETPTSSGTAQAQPEPVKSWTGGRQERVRVRGIRGMLMALRRWSRRRTYREGKVVSRFIAPDIRRDGLVISAARIDEGIITGRVRTTNVLYVIKGLVSEPEFEPTTELHIDEMWR